MMAQEGMFTIEYIVAIEVTNKILIVQSLLSGKGFIQYGKE